MSLYSLKTRRRRNATALHEANFAKLAKVVPALETLEEPEKVLTQEDARLELRLLEVSRYTKTFTLTLKHSVDQQWLTQLQLKVRNYYDAGVSEVLAFQRHQRLDSRYTYPNPKMYHRNEKWQVNYFLAEWLNYCLKHGYIFRQD